MYIDFGMSDKNLEELIQNIGAKHEYIGVKDKGLADRLGKLFEGIYSDFNQGAYTLEYIEVFSLNRQMNILKQDYLLMRLTS